MNVIYASRGPKRSDLTIQNLAKIIQNRFTIQKELCMSARDIFAIKYKTGQIEIQISLFKQNIIIDCMVFKLINL